jgi:predicted lipoprotein
MAPGLFAPVAALAWLLAGCGPSKIIYPPSGAAGVGVAGTGPGTAGSGGSAPDAGPPPFSVAALLGAFGTCASTGVQDFLGKMLTLEGAVGTWKASPSDTTREAARAAFQTAMDAWQIVEAMQFGPTGPKSTPGGQAFRDEIYCWPLTNRCAVEQLIISGKYAAATFPNELVNRRGLGALEYLLFYEGTDTACTAAADQAAWAALTDRDARKRAYAHAAATETRSRAGGLAAAWDAGNTHFADTLRTAGPGNKTYPTTQDALNAVSNAAFYIETDVKDIKLARPLGLRGCTAASCPELFEAPYAGRAKADIAGNFDGARKLLEGCGAGYSGFGFDDLLIDTGAPDAAAAAAALHEHGVAMQAALAAIEEADMRAALAADKPSVMAVYDAIKGLTDVMKTDFLTLLDLDLPGSIVGDND